MKATFHPKAFLSNKRNIKPGLTARTKILHALESAASNIGSISKVTRLSYKVVLHHLKLLEAEKIVTHTGNKPHVWGLTGMGQQRLTNKTLQ